MKGRIVTFLLMYSFAFNIWAQEDTLRIVRDSLRMMQETSGEMSIVPLLFPANDRLTFNVFGGYHSGYVPSGQNYHFGGTIGMEVSERFGMEMGVQRHYNPLRGGWETIPIAVPYFKFNNGAKFGLDVGGLLYEIFRDNSFKREIRNGNFSNPTIAPHRPRIEIR